MSHELDMIRDLVGPVSKEQLRYVDCFVSKNLGLFMPAGGACYYAVTPEHTHPAYMFVLPFNNQTSIKLGKKITRANNGSILALSPDIPHQELPSDFPPRYIAIMISRDFFDSQLKAYHDNRDISFSAESYKSPPDLLVLLKKFMIEADNKKPGYETLLLALGLEISHSILRTIFNHNIDPERISARLEVDKVIDFLYSNIGRKISVKEMSNVAHMSSSHFARVFKNETGSAPLEYLTRIRMERVKKLLLAGDKSITEIALECGFSSPSYLSTCFFKKYKMSPSEYMNIDTKGHISK